MIGGHEDNGFGSGSGWGVEVRAYPALDMKPCKLVKKILLTLGWVRP